MPEAAVYKNDRTVFGKDEVRVSGQSPIVNPKAEAPSMKAAAQDQFRLRVLPANARHHPAANFT